MGHFRVYTISDVLARFRRMKGYEVIHPMGWDAFGLPAENAAIERGVPAADWTKFNIAKMKNQLERMLGDFDWHREVTTCDPEYYKGTQQIFLRLYEAGLVYRKEAMVNWDPVDETVLANEQVDDEGKSWRSGACVEKRELEQWFVRITEYVQELLQDLCRLEHWPSRVIAMQRHWIGRRTGVEISFASANSGDLITVFTSRPNTIYGVQYIALSLSHPITEQLAEKDSTLATFIRTARYLPPDSKDGFRLPSVIAKHPLTKECLPVFVAPYVLDDYGEGAVMGVPAHDSRDKSFWARNMPCLSMKKVFSTSNSEGDIENDILNENCGEFSGMTGKAAHSSIISKLEEMNCARKSTQYKLRDWLVSRQRLAVVPVPRSDLPVKLPEKIAISQRGSSQLAKVADWVNVKCPKCKRPAKRETDTMDTFVDSSWYVMRYTDPHNENEPFSADKASKLLPVDIYIGGVEHAILHLLYSRFVSKFAARSGMWSGGETPGHGEPFKRLISQGMVRGKTYTDPDTGKFLKPEEIDINGPRIKATGKKPNISYEKMSKSKYNGVDPTACVEKYGADSTRAHILFAAPVSEELEWDEEKIIGMQRWLGRVWRLTTSASKRMGPTKLQISNLSKREQMLLRELHITIKECTAILSESYSLNLLIPALTTFTNYLIAEKSEKLGPNVQYHLVETLIRLIAPIAPSTAEECWEALGHKESIFKANWPNSEEYIIEWKESTKCAFQINGKMRFVMDVPIELVDKMDEVEEKARNSEQGKKWLQTMEGKELVRVVRVEGAKALNFVFK
ncbi:Leucine--tRNA ligase, mitochondrial [Neolecta irregularis DAH-3]|uniref:leucine--tRNA ligase n=1 Tax=Neolecta irregularis (strain DAH-3) TaxID=1198029 RepID=A0A1U7LT32_NEOID|nr:Leucine--tRNA ligase, mitochondrial [Neolecta irregularis DAH-3]|eukprot:OLL25830.1 Leucine--tRNA ligase, mitochondrial [Neolecta irregularis DAH-3]